VLKYVVMANHVDNQFNNHGEQEDFSGEVPGEVNDRASELLAYMDLANKLAVFANKAIESEQIIQIELRELDTAFNALSDALLDKGLIKTGQILNHIKESLTVKCVSCGVVFPKEAVLSMITQLSMVKRIGDSARNAKCPKCKESSIVEVAFNGVAISVRNRLDNLREANKKTVLFPRIGTGPDPKLCRLCQSAKPSTSVSFTLHIIRGPYQRTEKYSDVLCCDECAKRYFRLKRFVWMIPVFAFFLPVVFVVVFSSPRNTVTGLVIGAFVGVLAWGIMRFFHDTIMSTKLHKYSGAFRAMT